MLSRPLTQKVDRPLPHDFQVVHTPGRMLETTVYQSRHPLYCNGPITETDEKFGNWFLITTVETLTND